MCSLPHRGGRAVYRKMPFGVEGESNVLTAVHWEFAGMIARRINTVTMVWTSTGIFLAALFVVFAPDSAQASIMLPAGVLSGETCGALPLELDANESCGGSGSPDDGRRRQGPYDQQRDGEGNQLRSWAVANSSSMAPVPTSSGADSGGVTLMCALPKNFCVDYRVTEWLSPEQLGTIPMPPPSDLLRPPRC